MDNLIFTDYLLEDLPKEFVENYSLYGNMIEYLSDPIFNGEINFLHMAIIYGHIKIVDKFLHLADQRALELAIRYGRPDIADKIWAMGSWILDFWYLAKGRMVPWMLDHGADPCLGLSHAASRGNLEDVELLIRAAQDQKIEDVKLSQAINDTINMAICVGHIDIVRRFLPNVCNYEAVQYAIQYGRTEIAELLIPMFVPNNESLITAVMYNRSDILGILLRNHEPGPGIISHACLMGHVDIVKRLLHVGTKPVLQDLILAARSNIDIVNLLLDFVKPDTCVLNEAIVHNHLDIVNRLLETGLEVSNESILTAAKYGNLEIINRLLPLNSNLCILAEAVHLSRNYPEAADRIRNQFYQVLGDVGKFPGTV